ncbi:MAG: HAMP domain-containing histidine kinase [Anaerolineae bacterium]|nr:HAMP domain-containing histidine kinase [Anaerolineae bacterium]
MLQTIGLLVLVAVISAAGGYAAAHRRARAREEQVLITARKQATAEHAHMVEELDAYARMVAHNLKNPLGGITGYTSVLIHELEAGTRPPAELIRFARHIEQGSDRMSDMIDELLLLARMRTTDEIETTPIDTSALVRRTLDRLQFLIEEREAKITLPTEEWPLVEGHAPWIEEIWANYISNAIQHGGDPPHLELGATVTDGVARFWVRDNGPGIAPEEQTKIFEPFTRLNPARTKGHGLGLSIVKRIADKLGAQVGVESTVGQGSTFYFALPVLEL